MGAFDLTLDIFLLAMTVGSTASATARVIKTRTADGVSLVGNVVSALSVGTWIAYGAVNGNVSQVTTGVIFVLGVLVLLYIAGRNGELRTGVTLGTTVLYSAAVLLSCLTFGIAAAGAAATTLSIIGKLPQAWESWKNPGGVAVSISSFVMAAMGAAGWLLYGAIHADGFIVGSSALGLMQAVFVAARAMQASRAVDELADHAGHHDRLHLRVA